MKKLGIGLVVLLALSAAGVVTNALATDDGGAPANHSQGQAIFPYAKLKTASSTKTIPFYTTAAAWPTTFVPQTVTYDGGCQQHTLTATPVSGTVSGLTSTALPLYCIIDIPLSSLDAGTALTYKDSDGGYGLSLCPASAAFPTTALPAFCYRQAGISP